MAKHYREPLNDRQFMIWAVGVLLVLSVIVYFVFIRK